MKRATRPGPEWLGNNIRQNIKLLKMLRGLTDEQVAKLGGFTSRQVVADRVSGRTVITPCDLVRFASAFNVPVSQLIESSDVMLRWMGENADHEEPRYTKARRR